LEQKGRGFWGVKYYISVSGTCGCNKSEEREADFSKNFWEKMKMEDRCEPPSPLNQIWGLKEETMALDRREKKKGKIFAVLTPVWEGGDDISFYGSGAKKDFP